MCINHFIGFTINLFIHHFMVDQESVLDVSVVAKAIRAVIAHEEAGVVILPSWMTKITEKRFEEANRVQRS